jgi:hypothetical protein
MSNPRHDHLPGSHPKLREGDLRGPKSATVVDYSPRAVSKAVLCSVCRQPVDKTRIMAGRHMCLDCIAEFYGGEEE